MGPLITISQSAHIYDDTWENVESLIEQQYKKIYNQRDYYDAAGNFIVSKDKDTLEIVVEHTTPGAGEVIATYRGRTGRKLYKQIASDVPNLTTEHALYLGYELGLCQAEAVLDRLKAKTLGKQ